MTAEHQRRDEEHLRQFGHVRPPTALEVNGYKLVISGSGLIRQKAAKTKYFADILDGFVLTTFGRDWFEADSAKPMTERHPLLGVSGGVSGTGSFGDGSFGDGRGSFGDGGSFGSFGDG